MFHIIASPDGTLENATLIDNYNTQTEAENDLVQQAWHLSVKNGYIANPQEIINAEEDPVHTRLLDDGTPYVETDWGLELTILQDHAA